MNERSAEVLAVNSSWRRELRAWLTGTLLLKSLFLGLLWLLFFRPGAA